MSNTDKVNIKIGGNNGQGVHIYISDADPQTEVCSVTDNALGQTVFVDFYEIKDQLYKAENWDQFVKEVRSWFV